MRFSDLFLLAPTAQRTAFLVWLVAVLVYACGGDRIEAIRNLRSDGASIICFGDSLTEGVGAGPGEDYPVALSRELGMPVINAGLRGDTTATALARLADAVLSRNPRVVVVLLGGNDFLRRVHPEETRKNLEAIVERIQEQGAMVAIAGLRLGFFTDEYEPIFQETARKFGALYIPAVTKGILSDAKLRSDPIHPNHAGYRLMAARIAAKVRPLLAESDRMRGALRDG